MSAGSDPTLGARASPAATAKAGRRRFPPRSTACVSASPRGFVAAPARASTAASAPSMAERCAASQASKGSGSRGVAGLRLGAQGAVVLKRTRTRCSATESTFWHWRVRAMPCSKHQGPPQGKDRRFPLLHQGLEGIEGVFKIGQRIGVGAVAAGVSVPSVMARSPWIKRGPYPGPAALAIGACVLLGAGHTEGARKRSTPQNF